MDDITKVIRCCTYCGKELTGRSDKKFCDDGCRNNYRYQWNKYNNEIVIKVNKSLLHNRNVLKSMIKSGKKMVKKQCLVDNDFNFNLMTGLHTTNKRQEYRVIYDYAYRCVDDEYVMVLKYC